MSDSEALDLTVEPEVASQSPATDAAPRLSVSAAPHGHSGESIQRMMVLVLAALIPAAAVSTVFYGIHAVLLIITGTAAAVLAEWSFALVRERKLALPDAGAALTGFLLSLSLPPHFVLWGAAVGSFFAIFFVKIACGGLGRNFLNPALGGRAFLLLLFPAVFAKAGELGISPSGDVALNLLVGYQGGWLGSTSAAALLVGAIALWVLRVADFYIPIAFLAGAFVLSWLGTGSLMFHAAGPVEALCRIMGGGLPLVALFMAADPVTSPTSVPARLLFGGGCGILSFLLCRFGAANDGAMYAVLVMNIMVPYLNRYAVRRPMRPVPQRKTVFMAAAALPESEEVPAHPLLEHPLAVNKEEELR